SGIVLVCAALGAVAALSGWLAAGWFKGVTDAESMSLGARVDHSLPFTSGITSVPETKPPGGTVGTASSEAVTAHAAGAVVAPGLYTVASGSRVADLVRAAGGFAPEADADRVNLAAPVRDGMRLYVPRRGELQVPPAVVGDGPSSGQGAGTEPGPSGQGARVDLNRATAEDLEALPGIGPTLAGAIIEYRNRNGPFRSVEDLRKVSGIGEAKLRLLRDRVSVDG
ncbi:MAG: helix-hairpin-helix domain-containing protein, partial [Acidimicrobiales bacterium]|nr:helix-hairpin-helix domain-containing protein [Acidimicrobiales bacterium]